MYGKYKHSVDPKGRLFVPAKLREELGESFYVTLGLTTAFPYTRKADGRAFWTATTHCPFPSPARCVSSLPMPPNASRTGRAVF